MNRSVDRLHRQPGTFRHSGGVPTSTPSPSWNHRSSDRVGLQSDDEIQEFEMTMTTARPPSFLSSIAVRIVVLFVIGVAAFGWAYWGSPAAALSPTAVAQTLTPIWQIQGAGHRSGLEGQHVATSGVVTAIALSKEKNPVGFYLQDPAGDNDVATSDALLVFTRAQPGVEVGDFVRVEGDVKEFGFRGGLPVTELIEKKTKIESSGNPLPEPIVIGKNGRRPPTEIIDADRLNAFEPDRDGIDFFESLENMRVQVENAIITGSNDKGEIFVLSDGGLLATSRTPRGGVYITPDDDNPERIILDNSLSTKTDQQVPTVTVGDRLTAPVVGVLGYSFNNFKIWYDAELPQIEPGNLSPEITDLAPTPNGLTIASYNVLNLDPNDNDGDEDVGNKQLQRIASQIVSNLRTPDIIGLQEVQDNSGSAGNDGVTSADQTLQMLMDEIESLGQIRYRSVEIAPLANEDGGQPGGNIRNAFLYNPARVTFNQRGAGDAVTPTALSASNAGQLQLTLNPGRIDPLHPAFRSDKNLGWSKTRKSLAAEFEFKGETIFVINNHLRSKRGDGALFGDQQPPELRSVPQRAAQAEVVARFVLDLFKIDPSANVVVLGDMNDFAFSKPVQKFAGAGLRNAGDSIDPSDLYSYVYEGNSQLLDQILVSPRLVKKTVFDAVHTNAEFSYREAASDHDPLLIRIDFGEQ